ncbi:MAG: hypothetical protein RLP44_07550 [Aggregatilineales bacterium]
MAVTIKWLKQPDTPAFIFSARVADEDIDAWGKTGLEIAESGVIYPVVDFSAVITMPRNLINTTLRSRALLAFITHPNVRLFVFIAPNEQTHSMIETVFRAVTFKIALNQSAALDFLEGETQGRDSADSNPTAE